MHDFIPGQRWISDAEIQMGLGTILTCDQRTVTVLFLATGETRTYSKTTAPLTRATFTQGDTVRTHQGWTLKIYTVKDNDGLLTYVGTKEDGTQAELDEGELDNFIQLIRPTERLYSGQIDQDKWFELRYQTLNHANSLAHSDLHGLVGGRTSLIPHQLYIAHEVANRYAPRVLLADEVGLGKTIEAGLILHHQLLSERAKRVLIVLPESLIHQWLVEMLRRFNLHFSIFNEERCLAAEESTDQDNPFHTEQLIICDIQFLANNPQRHRQVLEGQWDLLVVDEAHHLQWSPAQPSAEYELIEQIAATTKGVLLLSATPEQLGKASHFARLRLLDPSRFSDLDSFIEEEKCYAPIAEAIDALMNNRPLDEQSHQIVFDAVHEQDNRDLLNTLQDANSSEQDKAKTRKQLIEHLLDRHGTGRVLFRNTRAEVKGFPERKVTSYPLALPECYNDMQTAFQSIGIPSKMWAQLLLTPELLYQLDETSDKQHWTKIDPRVEWLINQLKVLKPQKVLVITVSADTAADLAESLRTTAGIHAALFHEGLSIIERDRAAAFFADQEQGSQILVCSEIGSEGRNFQFAHHLILFDLPLNPDLLEQRIGRLDRIGQTERVNIHIPYLKDSALELMYQWYHHGLDAFEHTCPAGYNVFEQIEATLIEALHQIDEGLLDQTALIETTKQLHHELNQVLHDGRDRLLEFNSCRSDIANKIKEDIQDQDAESTLMEYMENIFDCCGADSEYHSEDCYIIRPSDVMQTTLPNLPDDGMTITYSRDIALSCEDMQFMSWEHPMVSNAIDMIMTNELGNTAVTAVKISGIKPGTLLLECLYILESTSSNALQSSYLLPPTTIRLVIDQQGMNHDKDISHSLISESNESVDTKTANEVVCAYTKELREMVVCSEKLARQMAPQILADVRKKPKLDLMNELNRLKALKTVNPNVRDEEIRFFESQFNALENVPESTNLRLDALRVIVAA